MRQIILFIVLGMSVILCHSEDYSQPTVPDGYIGGHAFVDLGLPSGTLWAVYNVGASNECESGDFFAWGETKPKDLYDWETYKYFKGYVEDPPFNYPWIELEDIGYCISGTEYDAATVNWGNGWSMPDSIQIAELKKYTFGKLTEINGVKGVKILSTRKEGKCVFFGEFSTGFDGFDYQNPHGHYWGGASLPGTACAWMRPTDNAESLITQLNCDDLYVLHSSKCAGYNIRAVTKRGMNGINGISDSGIQLSLKKSGRKIKFNRPVHNGIADLIDPTGKTVYSQRIKDTDISIPPLYSGLYIFSVKENGIVALTKKIIIKQ